jgi:hypothetical protein
VPNKNIKFLLSSRFPVNLFKHFFIAFGTLWLLVESFCFFLPQIMEKRSVLFSITLIGALIWALIHSFPRRSYKFKFKRTGIEIEIKVGDLFDETSNIIIGIDNYLPTKSKQLGGNSVRSQLTRKLYNGDGGLLNKAIISSLGNSNVELVNEKEGSFKTNIRSVAVLEAVNQKIFFMINQENKPDKIVPIHEEVLWSTYCNLWDVVKQKGYNKPLAVPLIGSGYGRAPISRPILIQLMLFSFAIANREFPITKKLTVVIHESEYDPAEMAETVVFIKKLDL